MGKQNTRDKTGASRRSLPRRNSGPVLRSSSAKSTRSSGPVLRSSKSAKITKTNSRSRLSSSSKNENSRDKKETGSGGKKKRFSFTRDGTVVVYSEGGKMSVIKRPTTSCRTENIAVKALLRLREGEDDKKADVDQKADGSQNAGASSSSTSKKAKATKGRDTHSADSSAKQGGTAANAKASNTKQSGMGSDVAGISSDQGGAVVQGAGSCPDEGTAAEEDEEEDDDDEKAGKKAGKKKKVLQCPYCPAQLGQRYRLRRHINSVHGDEKPYKCKRENCTKAYKAIGDLNRHIRFVHRKERPCVCTKCGAVFTRPHSLEAHHSSKKACFPRNSVLSKGAS